MCFDHSWPEKLVYLLGTSPGGYWAKGPPVETMPWNAVSMVASFCQLLPALTVRTGEQVPYL